MKVEIERKPKSVSWVDSRLETSRAVAVAVATVGLLFALHSPSARAAGEGQADAPPCAMCPGMLGEGSAYGVPRPPGQNPHHPMTAVSTTLNEKQIEEVAAYLSQLER